MAEALVSKYVQTQLRALNAALTNGQFVSVRKLLLELPPSDVAHILESSPSRTRDELWELIDSDFHGDILEELSDDVRNGIITKMLPANVVDALEEMDTDDLAETLSSLPEPVLADILDSMDAQDRLRAEQALSYGEETAGFIMNTDTITLRPDVTVDVVLRYIRLKGELPENTDTFYVVNRTDNLVGIVPVARLLTAETDNKVSEVMDEESEAIPVNMPDDEVASLFERYNWLSAPVVDENNRLVGRITIDDVVDIIREDAEHSMMSMAGLDDDEDTFAPVMQSTKRRSVWLAVNLVTALMAAMVSDLFEAALSQLAVLAILNTIVPSMGGVAGNQTLTLVIRGMALGHVNASNSRWLISKEIAIGFLNGAIWAILIASVIALWKQDYMLGIIIAFAMMINMIAAALAGATLPMIMKRLKIDPALAGSVILTTITDVVGIFAFLGTATLFLI
ncbi:MULTISPECIES: magnesium transporter [Alteromonas]|uniref:Magnesium transporter MgtE n=3 Tax=Alteromonas mediterranea TaxID=314275 RepID=S5ACJ1_9ALTE|nr:MULTISPECIES: magnesium transporter [Alteromonas]AGP77059.1 magnesium transporter [Alteromonas mediterranea 615]AGP92564.1 magnesium transporter [Alteromonas mediterranea U8]MBR9783716.1 magnesium transporter [Gammaproteobacteria bacterium]MEA3382718.1 magnesium transporter [Pseudomonadota bacterium]AEA96980.1 magnesium transporter [Alteromonas mediterranea DE]|tara:strand:- start:517 stop:1875 length:1359 start_codon:yes stop_codon:yes gene_type:complete